MQSQGKSDRSVIIFFLEGHYKMKRWRSKCKFNNSGTLEMTLCGSFEVKVCLVAYFLLKIGLFWEINFFLVLYLVALQYVMLIEMIKFFLDFTF